MNATGCKDVHSTVGCHGFRVPEVKLIRQIQIVLLLQEEEVLHHGPGTGGIPIADRLLPLSSKDLRLEQPDHGLCEYVVVRISDAPDRRLDAGLGQSIPTHSRALLVW